MWQGLAQMRANAIRAKFCACRISRNEAGVVKIAAWRNVCRLRMRAEQKVSAQILPANFELICFLIIDKCDIYDIIKLFEVKNENKHNN